MSRSPPSPEDILSDAASILKTRQQYNLRKANFVSNLHGSTIGEIVLVTLILPVAVFTWSALQSRWRLFRPYGLSAGIADWLINVGSILAVLTIYSSRPGVLEGLMLVPALAALATPAEPKLLSGEKKPPKLGKIGNDEKEKKMLDPFPMKPFVTMYRGSMMVVTCIAILAVDFRIFPRRFAKVENWGTSLMDLGVGSFVFSAGVLSVRTVLKARNQKHEERDGLSKRLLGSLRSSLALLGLGVARVLSVKGVEYQEHETEYGRHWNFFFTLGCLPPFVALFQSAFESILPSYPVLALVVASAYEIILDNTNLTAYIISAPRDNLISMNREGIASFFGYLAIFLAGQGAGMICLPREKPSMFSEAGWMRRGVTVKKLWSEFRENSVGRLSLHTIMYVSLFVLMTNYQGFNLRVSRRLANLPYVLGVAAFNSGQLVLCVLTEKLLFPNIYAIPPESKTLASSSLRPKMAVEEVKALKGATSTLLMAFNSNGLPLFLAANLLTGLVNLTMPTLEMKTEETMAVLVAYMGVLSGLALVLHLNDIKIKI